MAIQPFLVANAATALAANGSTDFIPVAQNGKVILVAHGGFGGGTVTWEQSPDDGTTWVPLGTRTVAGQDVYEVAAGTRVRGTLAGATGPTLQLRRS